MWPQSLGCMSLAPPSCSLRLPSTLCRRHPRHIQEWGLEQLLLLSSVSEGGFEGDQTEKAVTSGSISPSLSLAARCGEGKVNILKAAVQREV